MGDVPPDSVTHANLEETIRWQALVLQNVRESIIATDLTGTITYWNAGATDLFGYTAEEMLGRTPADLYPQLDPAQLAADLASIEAGRDFRGEWLGRRKDGTALWIDITTTRLYDASGTTIGFLGVGKDITALRGLERAREEFLAAVVHDLKTPLASIRGHAQLAARRVAPLALPATAPLTAHLAQIEEGTGRLARLIDELADVMRLETGGALDLMQRPTDVVALVRAVVARHAGLTAHRLIVETTLPEFEAALDASRIERVLGNLLSNAIKYSPRGSDVTVRIECADVACRPGVTITVQDRGVGIPAADLPHIFERFYRARNVAGTVPGTGIGLAGTRAIVEQHGGTIRLDSVEGVGTSISVWLPGCAATERRATGDDAPDA